MDIKFSKAQEETLNSVLDWYLTNSKPFLTLGGYAGTGKSTLVGYFRKLLSKQSPNTKVAFCSYTGKASRVLKQKLIDADTLIPGDYVGTIHRLIYEPVLNDDKHVTGWQRRKSTDFRYGLIIVDEASMLNQFIWQDLVSYHVPIFAVGDHGQLSPIEGQFNLMQKPDLLLEEIYRQEEGSPIIRLSVLARNEGKVPVGIFGSHVRKFERADPDTQEFLGEYLTKFNDDMLVLVGYNNTRIKLNRGIRELLGFMQPQPAQGDRIICLRNNHKSQIYNGMTGKVVNISLKQEPGGQFYETEILFDDEDKPFTGDLSVEQFGAASTLVNEKREGIELFDFGYALTVHKAQGSQAEKVVVFEERFKQMSDDNWRRWLYTAITRAERELYIIG